LWRGEKLAKQSKRILVLENDKDLREIIQNMLRFYGYEVVTALSVTQALELVKTLPPFVAIISDHKLPEINAVEFFKILNRFVMPLPQLILSTTAVEELIAEVPSLGLPLQLLPKPYSAQELLDLLSLDQEIRSA